MFLQAMRRRKEVKYLTLNVSDFYIILLYVILATASVTQTVKNPPASVTQTVKNPHGFDSWVGKILWKRAWQPTLVFSPGESPWTEESGGLQSMGLQRVRHN